MQEILNFYHISKKRYTSCIQGMTSEEKQKVEDILMKQKKLYEPGVFGVIFHWGLYSVPAFDDVASAKRRKIKNGSEWYQNRLYKTFRESNADKATKTYHETHYDDKLYSDFSLKL